MIHEYMANIVSDLYCMNKQKKKEWILGLNFRVHMVAFTAR